MRAFIDFAPPPPKDAPKKEHREYNKSVRKAYANAKKQDKEYFKEALKKAKNGDAEAMSTLYYVYAKQKKHKKAQFWREQAIANGVIFSRSPGSVRPAPEPEEYKNINNKPTFKIGDLEAPYEFDFTTTDLKTVEETLAKKVAETTKGDEEKIKEIIEKHKVQK